jgi:ATP-dependent DNA helicase RecG
VCAYLNGAGGLVIMGVSPKGIIEGQQVSDKTLRDISQALNQTEHPKF